MAELTREKLEQIINDKYPCGRFISLVNPEDANERISELCKLALRALSAPAPQQNYADAPVLPCDLVVGAGTFHAGIAVETAQGAIFRLHEHMQSLEIELGRLCYHCKLGIFPGQHTKSFNPAPDAVNGGTWFTVHEKCPSRETALAEVIGSVPLSTPPAPEQQGLLTGDLEFMHEYLKRIGGMSGIRTLAETHPAGLVRGLCNLLLEAAEALSRSHEDGRRETWNEARVRAELGGTISDDGALYNIGHYIAWDVGDKDVTLDCRFSPDELEAIAWWMRHKTPKGGA